MKPITSSVLGIMVAITLVGGAMFFVAKKNAPAPDLTGDNVTMKDNVQVVEIFAKGGYTPRVSIAKADTPTTLRIKTQGTFDCSSAVSIPMLDYRTNLAPSGVTDIEVPAQKAGTTLKGLCAMGMYTFSVKFQ